jgi:hypothetical protein
LEEEAVVRSPLVQLTGGVQEAGAVPDRDGQSQSVTKPALQPGKLCPGGQARAEEGLDSQVVGPR